jgi:hypothetical protein
MLATFVERWHGETMSFHIPLEIIVTLDDVCYLLHFPNEGRLIDHSDIICKYDVIEFIVNYLSSSPIDTDYEDTSTKVVQTRFTYLRCILTSNLRVVRQVERDRDVANMHMYRDGQQLLL